MLPCSVEMLIRGAAHRAFKLRAAAFAIFFERVAKLVIDFAVLSVGINCEAGGGRQRKLDVAQFGVNGHAANGDVFRTQFDIAAINRQVEAFGEMVERDIGS